MIEIPELVDYIAVSVKTGDVVAIHNGRWVLTDKFDCAYPMSRLEIESLVKQWNEVQDKDVFEIQPRIPQRGFTLTKI